MSEIEVMFRRIKELDWLYLEADKAHKRWVNHEGSAEEEQRLHEECIAAWDRYTTLRDEYKEAV